MNLKPLETITLSKTSGTKTLVSAVDVFSYIDADLENWQTDTKGIKTSEMKLAVCELTEDSTFEEIFTTPETMCLSQSQIIEFCTTHKDKLSKDWYIFFLFKVDSEFFVARVRVRVVDGSLGVYVRRFSCDCVWHAERGHRFVIPQLALESSEPMTLSAAIEKVKEAGYKIFKEI